MTETVETMLCHYCGWPFAVTARHRAEKVVPYCSLGCRRLSEERHVAYEAKHIEMTELLEREMAEAVERQADISAALVDLPEGVADRLREFLRGWLRLPAHTRDVLALRFTGMSYSDAARRIGVTVQAVHKAAVEAATRNAVIDAATGLAKEAEVDPARMVIDWN